MLSISPVKLLQNRAVEKKNVIIWQKIPKSQLTVQTNNFALQSTCPEVAQKIITIFKLLFLANYKNLEGQSYEIAY